MVFQTEPGSNSVMPRRSWQLSQTAGWTYCRMTRALASSAEPRGLGRAMSRVTRTVGQARWAGALTR